MKDRHLIGFSLSSCVRDICRGAVDIEEVLYIQTGCSPRNHGELEEILDQYDRTYWKGFGEQAKDVVSKLMTDIDGSRIGWASSWPEKSCCNIAWGWWLSTKNAIDLRNIKILTPAYPQRATTPEDITVGREEKRCCCPSVACPIHGLPPGSASGGW